MRQVKFLEAIKEAIQEKVDGNKTFSAHEITLAIREKVNSRLITIEGFKSESVEGKITQLIEHKQVRSRVWAIARNRSDVSSTLNRGRYVEYGAKKPQTSSDPVARVNPRPPVAGTPTAAKTFADRAAKRMSRFTKKPDPKAAHIVPISNSWANKVVAYVRNRLTNGTPATLKSAQSRMKGMPLSTRRIEAIVVGCGYRVIHRTPYCLSEIVKTSHCLSEIVKTSHSLTSSDIAKS